MYQRRNFVTSTLELEKSIRLDKLQDPRPDKTRSSAITSSVERMLQVKGICQIPEIEVLLEFIIGVDIGATRHIGITKGNERLGVSVEPCKKQLTLDVATPKSACGHYDIVSRWLD